MKVKVLEKSGREKTMDDRYAKVLVKLGRATYLTRDIVPINHSKIGDELDEMDVSALLALAKQRGIKVHHKAGADKIRSALREAEK